MRLIHPGGFAISEEMIRFSGAKTDGDWLDTSAGSGESLAWLAAHFPARITGIDISKEHVATAERRLREAGLTNASVLSGDANRLPFPDESFDLVYSECSASLFDKAVCLPEWRRALRPGGVLAVHDVFWVETPEPAMRSAEKERLGGDPLTREEWAEALDRAGFTAVRFEDRSRDLEELRSEISRRVTPEELSGVFFESVRRDGWRRAGLFYFLYLWLGERPGKVGYILLRAEKPR